MNTAKHSSNAKQRSERSTLLERVNARIAALNILKDSVPDHAPLMYELGRWTMELRVERAPRWHVKEGAAFRGQFDNLALAVEHILGLDGEARLESLTVVLPTLPPNEYYLHQLCPDENCRCVLAVEEHTGDCKYSSWNHRGDITEIVAMAIRRGSQTIEVIDCTSAEGVVTVRDDNGQTFRVQIIRSALTTFHRD